VALPAFVACEPGPPSPPRVGPMPLLPGIAVETAMSRCTTEASAPMLLPPPVPRGPSSWENVTGCLFVPSLLSTQGVLAHEASPSTLFGGGHIEEGFFYFVSGLLACYFSRFVVLCIKLRYASEDESSFLTSHSWHLSLSTNRRFRFPNTSPAHDNTGKKINQHPAKRSRPR
jgi:hypothetical protein